jgi:hypothetical protein
VEFAAATALFITTNIRLLIEIIKLNLMTPARNVLGGIYHAILIF